MVLFSVTEKVLFIIAKNRSMQQNRTSRSRRSSSPSREHNGRRWWNFWIESLWWRCRVKRIICCIYTLAPSYGRTYTLISVPRNKARVSFVFRHEPRGLAHTGKGDFFLHHVYGHFKIMIVGVATMIFGEWLIKIMNRISIFRFSVRNPNWKIKYPNFQLKPREENETTILQ